MSRIATRLTRLESALNPDDEPEIEYRVFFQDEPIPPECEGLPVIQLKWADELGEPEIPDSGVSEPVGIPE